MRKLFISTEELLDRAAQHQFTEDELKDALFYLNYSSTGLNMLKADLEKRIRGTGLSSPGDRMRLQRGRETYGALFRAIDAAEASGRRGVQRPTENVKGLNELLSKNGFPQLNLREDQWSGENVASEIGKQGIKLEVVYEEYKRR